VLQYTASKSELITGMTDRLFADIVPPNIAIERRRERLEYGARLFRANFAEHPWAASALSLTLPQLLPDLLRLVEWNLQTLQGLGFGFGIDEMMFAHISIFNLVSSLPRTEAQKRQASADTAQNIDAWAASHFTENRGQMSPDATPTLLHVARVGFDYNLDRLFNCNLQALLVGITRRNSSAAP
jgi:hypothetical protein